MPLAANRFRMGNDPADRRKLALQSIFNLVHNRVDIINCFRRREAAMIVNEQALVSFPDTDIVQVAEAGLFPGQCREKADNGL